jgi:hypothetical protein
MEYSGEEPTLSNPALGQLLFQLNSIGPCSILSEEISDPARTHRSDFDGFEYVAVDILADLNNHAGGLR